MKKITFLVLVLTAACLYSQTGSSTGFVGKSTVSENVNGNIQYKIVTTPQLYNAGFTARQVENPPTDQTDNNSSVRWKFTDPIAIGYSCDESGDGLSTAQGWGLNTQRVSLYGNSNNVPAWEFYTNPTVFTNFVAISGTGNRIAAASLYNIYIFNSSSSTPIFNFDLTALPDTGNAGMLDITSDGNFIVANASRNDSSWVFGFSKDSTHPAWRYRVGPGPAGGASIQGTRISGNDSLVIVNTYSDFYVFRTYTGQLVYQGLINPSSNNGTQSPQAISGDGSVIATINYNGFVRVYTWNGSTYNFLWQHQEPPGAYYNWMTAVDVSYDGSMVAAGTLNFVTSSTYDGKIKLFRTTNGSTPIWTYSGAGDEVNAVSFSKNGNILSACSWGDYYNPLKDNMFVFKTSHTTSTPLYSFSDSSGSFFSCSTSDDGTTVIGTGKRVHARSFGNGGVLYNVLVDTAEPTGVINNHNIADKFELLQNYPNPFNPSTQINYAIAKDGFVKITVFDILGREVAVPVNQFRKSGNTA